MKLEMKDMIAENKCLGCLICTNPNCVTIKLKIQLSFMLIIFQRSWTSELNSSICKILLGGKTCKQTGKVDEKSARLEDQIFEC